MLAPFSGMFYFATKSTIMVQEYISLNKDRFLAELFEWLRIPSVSADSNHKGDVRKAAEFLKAKFTDAGVGHR